MPHYIAFVTDPTLKDDTLVFSVRDVKNQVQARHAIVNKYEQNGWPYDGISIRLAALRSQQVQHLGHTRADPDVEAIRALCEEVLRIASDEPVTPYADKLRALVQSFAIGKQAYESYYGRDQDEL
jgi:hypothetical protein